MKEDKLKNLALAVLERNKQSNGQDISYELDHIPIEIWRNRNYYKNFNYTLDRNIDDFPQIPVRIKRCCKLMRVMTIRDLTTKTEKELLEMLNIGRKSINTIKVFLKGEGLTLGMKL